MALMPSIDMLQTLLGRSRGEAADAALQGEIAQEQAAALGRMGRKAEAALAALRAHEGEGRDQVLKVACDAVWCLLVQREVMGLRDRARIVADYQIPREVMARLGAR